MNKALLITYDLNQPGQRYEDLIDAIKDSVLWWHYLKSTWIVDTASSIEDVTQALLERMDTNDLLLVVDITNDAYNGWLTEDAWAWVNEHTRKLTYR